MATAMNLSIGQNYTINTDGEYYFYNGGTYEIKIFGSSGNGYNSASSPAVGGGGGGGAFGYFRINMTGNDADNNKVKITYDNSNNFTIEIKSRNPTNQGVWQANYYVTAGKNGKSLLNLNLEPAAGGTITYTSSSDLQNAEFLEYAFGSDGINGQNATSIDLNLSAINLGTLSCPVYGGKGGSYTTSNGESYKGFSGGDGIINIPIVISNQSASSGKKGEIIISRVSNSNPGTGTEGGGNSGGTEGGGNSGGTTPGGSGSTTSGKEEIIEYNNSNNTIDLYRIQSTIDKFYNELKDEKVLTTKPYSWSSSKGNPVTTIHFSELVTAISSLSSYYKTCSDTCKSYLGHTSDDYYSCTCESNCGNDYGNDYNSANDCAVTCDAGAYFGCD